MTETATLTLTDFLLERLSEVADCDGTGEYRRCHDLSEWAERTVDAQRGIIALHYEMDGGDPESYPYTTEDGRTIWPGCAVCHAGSPSRPHCDTVRALAAVYADHPDYSDEWRP